MRHFRDHLKNKRGLALSELMVATAIMTFVTLGVGKVYVSGQQSFYYIEGSARNMQEARLAADQMTRDLRSTISISEASDTHVIFNGDYNGDATTEAITYALSGGSLIRTIGSNSKTIASGIVNSASEPLLKYYDQDGNEVADISPADSIPDNIDSIKLIELSVKVDKDTTRSPNRSTAITSRVQLRNLHERR